MVSENGNGPLPEGVDERLLSVVRDGIASGRFSSGARIPTERDFAASLEIPRSVVRRSLAYLETQGRVTRHVGRGTFVADGAGSAETPLGFATSPIEIMEVRLMLEPQVAAAAAAAATAAEFEKLTLCLERSEAAATYEEFERCDAEFHRSIAVATHNEFCSASSTSSTRHATNRCGEPSNDEVLRRSGGTTTNATIGA